MEPNDVNRQYEQELLEHGFKWSPVKVYRRSISRGVTGDTWRLKITQVNRSQFQPTSYQNFALLVTIRDPKTEKQVYNELVNEMQNQGWAANDLEVRQEIRARFS